MVFWKLCGAKRDTVAGFPTGIELLAEVFA